MAGAGRYMEHIGEQEDGSFISMDEIKTRVTQLAEKAWAGNEHSYKAYLSQFGQLIESYIVSTNSQNVRGAIFFFACEHDYHMPGEIEALPVDISIMPAQGPDDVPEPYRMGIREFE
jgi:hypothetical protein